MDEVLAQAPTNMNLETIKEVFEKHEKQVLPTLLELWDIQDSHKEKTKWEEIRDTCDSFDKEMQNMLQEARDTNKVS